MQKANTDTTYCMNTQCPKGEECWRHFTHYEFDKDKNYWQTDYCEEYKEMLAMQNH